jgi:hypothetical protein
VKAQEAKLGKEISDAGDKLKAKLRKGVQVDDNATPPD